MSPTQLANITALASVIVLILGRFGVAVAQEDVVTVGAALISIGSIVVSYWRRYQKGDVTVFGAIK